MIMGDFVNVNLITSMKNNGKDTLIYFEDRNDDHTPYITIPNMKPDEVMKELLSQLNGGDSKITEKQESKIDKAALDDFIEGI